MSNTKKMVFNIMITTPQQEKHYKECEIISIDNRKPYITPVRIVNTIGQEVSIDYNGLKFVTYEDGSVERVY